jgi:ribosome modulation factor
MKNISKQYADLLEGKMSRDNFVRNARMQFPQFISPVTSIDDAIKILKSKRMIAEMQDFQTSMNLDAQKQGYEDNHNGYGLEDCPHTGVNAGLWKDGWMEAETEKQMEHDEDTYDRETYGYGDLYKESLNEAEKTEGRYKEVTGKDQYGRFSDLDNVNFQIFLTALAFEVNQQPGFDDKMLPALMEKIAKNMKKDPNAYRELITTNYAEIEKQDETLKMKEVKPGNMVDKDNGMKEIKGQEKPKATSAPKTENKKGKPKGVKEMGITPKKAAGIKAVMDMPGKEKILDQLKESLKKTLVEDTHYNYSQGKAVETPEGPGMVRSVTGGTITVELEKGELVDYQINILDKMGEKQQVSPWDKLQAQSPKAQSWLKSQTDQLEEKPKKDKYAKLKEFIKKALKKEAIKFKAGGETIFTDNQEAGAKEAELKKAGVKYTKSNA